ncbi:MAG: LysM peptidoglycan-binding domain-containing protein [Anaerolineae bacterium]|nr:LysM peptidoglycan-binding domain-containing protein [Anaerolineae bacterium]
MLLLVVGLAGCAPSSATETPAPLMPSVTLSATLTASPPPTLTATPTPPEIAIITPASTPTPVTPSATPTITNTPGPFEHVIAPNDQLIAIVQEYGHYDLAVLDAVVALNPSVPNANQLPPPGSTILIPRPTPSPTPPGGELTATVLAQNPRSATPAPLTMVHVVEEGQTVIGIALQYNTTMAILAELNPRLYWFNCDFTIASGGENCSPQLSIGDELVVPMPTPTPTLSPTPSGSETPTLTPTPGPVRLLWPGAGAIIQGGPLTLRWVSAGVFEADRFYQVTVTNYTTGTVFTEFVKANSLTLPGDLQPADDAVHEMAWQVEVVQIGNDNVAFRVGAAGEVRNFQWSR